MKKTLTTVLIFAVILAALLGVAALAERLSPQSEPTADGAAREKAITNTLDETRATVITLSDDGISTLGVGADHAGNVVTIRYPGTYRVEGTLTTGQLVVDLGDYNGAVYIVMNGASVSCTDGPALYVKQADLTVLHLADGTVNTLRDGEDYVVEEKLGVNDGAGIYSCDELLIEGGGTLNVSGSAADGIRTKDGLTITGGVVSVYSQDDGLQGSDYVKISGGAVTVITWGDGITTTEGPVEISGGTLDLTCAGDGVDAAAELDISGGSMTVLAHGGSAYYAAVALGDLSAKGLKGQDISITGGALSLNTADDGVHARNDLTVSGGELSVASGDDGLKAAGKLEITGGDIDITESYEGIEGGSVSLQNVSVSINAQHNGVDAGEGGFTADNSGLFVTAPRGVSSDGEIYMRGGLLELTADGADSLFSFTEAELVGTTVIAYAGTNTAETLTQKGELPNSLLFVFREPVAAGARFVLTDEFGQTILTFFRNEEASAVLVSSGAFLEGKTYTLTVTEPAETDDTAADDASAEPAEPQTRTMTGVVGEGTAVVEPEGGLIVRQQGGFPGMPGPGGRR